MAYPTRGIELVVPSKVDIALGQPWGVNFARRGHEYAVRFYPSGLDIERDGQKVRRWDDVPPAVQAIITKSRDTYSQSMAPEGWAMTYTEVECLHLISEAADLYAMELGLLRPWCAARQAEYHAAHDTARCLFNAASRAYARHRALTQS